MTSSQSKEFLIDEPEAFLHPSLAYKLAIEICKIGKERGGHVFVSTHSTSFVMGCVASGVDIDVVRLTYNQGSATARHLESADLRTMMRNPLLRSSRVIDAIFHSFVIVTEADADRAFYQEINDRLTAFSPERSIPHCLFINAQNKQTIWIVVSTLRKLGIPACAIVDLDVFKDGGNEWSKLLNAICIPDMNHESLKNDRAQVMKAYEGIGDPKKLGISALPGSALEGINNILNRLEEYGCFVVPVGELECWLPSLAIPRGEKSSWLTKIFERLGSDSDDPNYVKPAKGDVWDFIGKCKGWLFDEGRKGIPLE